MDTDFTSVTWETALSEFLLHKKAVFSEKTARYYRMELNSLVKWANSEGISLAEFGKRHMDRYIAHRIAEGKSRTTLRHDGVCAKNFLAWCARNDLLDRSRLAEYEVHNAPRPSMYMPEAGDIRALLEAAQDYWNPAKNPQARYQPAPKRLFHRDRNRCILLGLIDTACRIEEMLSLKAEDWRPESREIVIRHSKGKEQRTVPVSPRFAEALAGWLRMRNRVMRAVPKDEDQGWLFVSETGGKPDYGSFRRNFGCVTRFASLPDEITLHSLRRFALNNLAKTDLLMAQAVAGHKDTKTTLIYTKLDPAHVREKHALAATLDQVLSAGEVMSNPRAKSRRIVYG